MSCKYLTKKHLPMHPEIGGSPYPSFTEVPSCRLGRLNRPDSVIGEAKRCHETPYDGPCWWWIEEHPDITDEKY